MRTQEWLAEQPREDQTRFGPLAPIAATGLFYAGLASSSPQAFGLLAASLGDPRHLIEDAQARAVIATALPMFDRLARSVAEAVEAGHLEPGDAMDRTLLLWSSLHGVAQLAKLDRLAADRLNSQRLCSSLLEVLLVGWGGEKDRVAAVVSATHSAAIAQSSVSSQDLLEIPAVPGADVG